MELESARIMLMGISTTQLEKMKEYVDEMQKITDNAIKIRKKIMDYTETEQEWKLDQYYDPEKYYTCRNLQQAVQITLTNRIYDIEHNVWIRTRKKYYTIKCTKWTPNKELYKNIIIDNVNMCYGQYETLEEARKEYYKYIANFIEHLGYNIYEDLEIFK